MQYLRLLLSPEPKNADKRIMPSMIVTILEHQTPQLILIVDHMLLPIHYLPFRLLYLLLAYSIAS